MNFERLQKLSPSPPSSGGFSCERRVFGFKIYLFVVPLKNFAAHSAFDPFTTVERFVEWLFQLIPTEAEYEPKKLNLTQRAKADPNVGPTASAACGILSLFLT